MATTKKQVKKRVQSYALLETVDSNYCIKFSPNGDNIIGDASAQWNDDGYFEPYCTSATIKKTDVAKVKELIQKKIKLVDEDTKKAPSVGKTGIKAVGSWVLSVPAGSNNILRIASTNEEVNLSLHSQSGKNIMQEELELTYLTVDKDSFIELIDAVL